MIAVQIEFLGAPKLSDPSNPRYAEWPPAPDRVFQALVASAGETGQDMSVLRHLESAPLISCGEAQCSEAPKNFVPRNFESQHIGTLVYMPHAMVDNTVVTYAWDIPETLAPELRPIVEALTYVGRSSSFVRASLVGEIEPAWVPDAHGELLMRVPHQGRLDELQTAYQAGRRCPPPRTTGYRRTDTVYPTAGWGELRVLRPKRALDQRDTLVWTDKMRVAVMSNAPADMPSVIHGHDNHHHIAWTALPNVGNPYARGEILGLGCWLPTDMTLTDVAILGVSMLRVREIDGVQFELDHVGLKGLQPETWCRASRIWATVTPIALDRWPRRNLTPEESVRQSVEMAGLPSPAEVSVSGVSPWKGAIHSKKWSARKGPRYITHATMVWDQPVAGPMLIGADRYFGGGLCRPLHEEVSDAS
jgi:CRISPR-associated protein Csb2